MNILTRNNTQPVSTSRIQFKGLPVNNRNYVSGNELTGSAFTQRIAGILNLPKEKVEDLVKDYSITKRTFLRDLTDRYNVENFYRPQAEKCDPERVINICKTIKEPTYNHLYVINSFDCSTENLERTFSIAEGKKGSYGLIEKVNKNILGNSKSLKAREELIPELLESDNAEEYIKNYEKYESYLILNQDNKDAVKELDKMVENKTFDRIKYDIELEQREIFGKNKLPETPVLNKKVLTDNYNPEGIKLLATISHISEEELLAGNDAELLEMYKTTNKKNLKMRLMLASQLDYSLFCVKNSSGKNPNIAEMQKLFDKIENKKGAAEVVKTIIMNNGFSSMQELNKLVDDTPEPKSFIDTIFGMFKK